MRAKAQFGLVIVLTAWCAVASTAQQPRGCTVSSSISPVKQSYIFQEPIRLNMTLSNLGREPVTIMHSYPYVSDQLSFSESNQHLPETEEYANRQRWGGKSIPRTLDSGGTWTLSIFLQTYTASLSPGLHKLDYEVVIPCVQGPGLITAAAKGMVSIRVEPPNPGQLRKIVGEYGRQASAGDSEAFEALLSMDSPYVVPELEALIQGSNWQRALQTLSRFKGDPAAERIVSETVQSKVPTHKIAGLRVLGRMERTDC
jgi:hypothetical protein